MVPKEYSQLVSQEAVDEIANIERLMLNEVVRALEKTLDTRTAISVSTVELRSRLIRIANDGKKKLEGTLSRCFYRLFYVSAAIELRDISDVAKKSGLRYSEKAMQEISPLMDNMLSNMVSDSISKYMRYSVQAMAEING